MTTSKQEMAPVLPAEMMKQMAQHADAGYEEADNDCYAIPFLKLLQKLSPECDTVEGAKPGMFYNTGTGSLFTNPQVIPCCFSRRFLHWTPRSQGGGFQGAIPPSEAVALNLPQDERGNPVYEDGSFLQDTREHYVLVIPTPGAPPESAVISLSGTRVKRSKKWMTALSQYRIPGMEGRPPMFARTWGVSVTEEHNDQGDWFSWEFTPGELVTNDTLFHEALQLSDAVRAGTVKSAEPGDDDDIAF